MTSSVSISMGGGIRPLPLSLLTPMGMGARRKKLTVFRCAKAANKIFFVLLRHFRLHVSVFIASAEGASENVWVFHRRAAYDVICFKFHGRGASAPPPFVPLRAPMPMGACSMISKFCFSQYLHPKFNINKA